MGIVQSSLVAEPVVPFAEHFGLQKVSKQKADQGSEHEIGVAIAERGGKAMIQYTNHSNTENSLTHAKPETFKIATHPISPNTRSTSNKNRLCRSNLNAPCNTDTAMQQKLQTYNNLPIQEPANRTIKTKAISPAPKKRIQKSE